MARKPRSEVIDLDVTDLYHTDSRCVRRAFLFAVGDDHRKRHLENRARFLQLVFAIDVLFVSFMDNHLEVWVVPIDMPPDGEPLPERSVDSVLAAEARGTTDHAGGRDDGPASNLSRHINRIKGWPVRISRSVPPAFLTIRVTLDDYLKFVDYAARLLRDGKARLDEAARPILERLDRSADGFADLILGLQAKATARSACVEVPQG